MPAAHDPRQNHLLAALPVAALERSAAPSEAGALPWGRRCPSLSRPGGYGQPGRGGGHFDAGVGARLGWPLEPYAKGTYRFARPFLGRNLIRLREAIFWEEQEHFGATTRVDLERPARRRITSCAGPARAHSPRKPKACAGSRT